MSDTPNLSDSNNPQDPEDADMYFDRPLKEYARSFSYPPTPDIAARVRERLGRERVAGARSKVPARPKLAWVAVAVVVLSLAAALFTPGVQAFVRYLLRIGSVDVVLVTPTATVFTTPDRKSTRLNSSHANISYAVFCLKKKKKDKQHA